MSAFVFRSVRISHLLVPLTLAAFPAAFFPALAEAQSVSASPLDRDEGSGVRLTDGVTFHPSALIGTGYQSNVFYEAEEDAELQSSALLNFGVGLGFATKKDAQADAAPTQRDSSSAKVAFDAQLDFNWKQYLSSEDVIKEHSDLGIGALVSLTINPHGTFRPYLRDGYIRAIEPPRVATAENIDRDRNELTVGLAWLPGGGALTIRGEYIFLIDFFERSQLEFGNKLSHRGRLSGTWQWLPYTQIQAQAELEFTDPDELNALSSDGTAQRYWVGISSLLTPTIATVLRIGYGYANMDAGPGYNSYLARAEARWAPVTGVRATVGYERKFETSIIANFYKDDAFFARIEAALGEQVRMGVGGTLSLRDFDYADDTGPIAIDDIFFCSDETCDSSDREDMVLQVGANIDYRLTRHLVLSGTYNMNTSKTDFLTRSGAAMTPSAFDDHAQYSWHEVLFVAQARY